MTGERSAFAVLGLDPAADEDEVERAYRRLIKKHHPDREGGDAARAAEINRAYNELRSIRDLKDPLDFHDKEFRGPRVWAPWIIVVLLMSLAGAALLMPGTPFRTLKTNLSRSSAPPPKLSSEHDPMDQALNAGEIDGAALKALQLSRTRDEMTLSSTSADCHRALRTGPSMQLFDRCVAFDDAVVLLEDRDPLRDQGPFSELAVTGRLWSGASALSEDSVAIDGRLDRVRLRVETALASVPVTRQAR